MKSYECTIFMGSIRHGSEGTHFTEQDWIEEIQFFQLRDSGRKIPVRITNTRFVFQHYSELGFEISAIFYPRFPVSPPDIRTFMCNLGEYLKDHFDQRSLCLMDAQSIIYLGDEL